MLARQEGWIQPNERHRTSSIWARYRNVLNFDDARLRARFPAYSQRCHGNRNSATNHITGDGWWSWWILLKSGEVNEYRTTFLLRTVPGPPFPVQNYLLSLLGVRFPVYISISLLAQGAIAAGMVACGGALPEAITLGHVLVGLALLSVLIGMKFWLAWRKRKASAIRAIIHRHQ